MIDKEIKANRDCMGCHACRSICPRNCIHMGSDIEGFWYPQVNYSLCVKCNRCVEVCPIINKTYINNIPKAYACVNNNNEVRVNSSSGGIFTLLSEQIIDEGGVVFGAGFEKDFEVVHSFVERKGDLVRLRGSKYLQSRIGDAYRHTRKFLELGRKVLFAGTPCQIAGLKSFLGEQYKDLLCIDMVCHGVPSPDLWKKYVDFRQEISGSRAEVIKLRTSFT